MKELSVFLTWSGDRSLSVAQALRDWLPSVLQFVAPWISVSDVDKGSKWQQSISGQLARASFGIICLTPENLAAPWILFEAGALSKTADSRVWTYLYDLGYTEVKDPLSQFQHTLATKVETAKLVSSINAAYGEGALEESRAQASFEKWWPDLEGRLASIPPPAVAKPKLNDTQQIIEMTAEILTRVREFDKLAALPPARRTPTSDFDSDRLLSAIRRRAEEATKMGRSDLMHGFAQAESSALESKQRFAAGDFQEGKRLFGQALCAYKESKYHLSRTGLSLPLFPQIAK